MSVTPPRWADRLLRRVLPEGQWGASVRGDLHQEFLGQVRRRGLFSARLWFAHQALTVVWCSLRDRRRGEAWGTPDLRHTRTSRMHLTGLGAELRQTIRGLWRRPARTALVVLTLAAGIAALTTIYTVVDAVIVRPLPYAESHRLVTLGMVFPGREVRPDAPHLQQLAGVSIPTMVDWQTRASSFEAIEAVEQRVFLFPDRGRGPELVPSATATPGFLGLIGGRIALGRGLQPSDFAETAPPVAVIAHHSWMQRYGGDPGVIGHSEAGLAIVGVLAPDLVEPEALFSQSPEFWTPMIVSGKRYNDRGRRSANVIGRLAPDVTVEAARAELARVQADLARDEPRGNVFPDGTRFGAGVNALHAETVGASATPLAIYFGAAGLLLLIAAMNSTNLLLLRSLEREGETALRRALGANQSRLVAGLLLEGVTLAVLAGVLGVLLAQAGVQAFLQMGPASIPRLGEVAMNGRVLVVSAAASLGTGLVAALWPALRLARSSNLGTGMRDVGATSVTASGSRLRLSLVIGQLAAAVILGIGASLLMQALVQVSNRNLGFEPRGLTAIAVPMKQPGTQGTSPAALWDRALSEVQAVSGIAHLAAASDPPFADPSWAPWLSLPGDAPGSRRSGIMAFVVTPGFFDTVGTTLSAGRDFSVADSQAAEPVVIVNQAFVSAHLAGRSPLGRLVLVRNEGSDTDTPRRIVGVVADIVQRRVEDAVAPAVYVPHHQVPWPFTLNLLVSSERSGPAFSDELRRAVGRFSPAVPITAMYPLTSPMERTLVEPTFRAGLFASFAGLSMLLAVIGLYGSLSHTVGRRTRELGLRMALGADRRSIFSMVLRQGALVAALGLGLGLAGAALMARTLQGFLYGVSPFDPLIFAGTALGLGGVALLAALSPARRAARVDVMTSLRE